MLYEYAVEPTLLNNWKDFRYFTEKFGISQGRLISRYPEPWEKMVLEALTDCGDVEKLRIVERLRELDDRMLERQHSKWEDRSDWLTNAETEHSRSPILARSNPNQRDFVLEGDTVEERHPLWKTRTSPVVARTAQEMSACVAPLLRVSNEILFIDPHFGPENARHRRPLEALFAITLKQHCGVPPEKVEIHTGGKSEAAFFKEQCSQRLPKIIPQGMRVRLVRWYQRDGGEKLHNRYILTDKGGVSLGVGLDDGTPGETDEIKLLDKETWEFRWKQYTSEPAFDRVDEDEIVIEGRRTLRI